MSVIEKIMQSQNLKLKRGRPEIRWLKEQDFMSSDEVIKDIQLSVV